MKIDMKGLSETKRVAPFRVRHSNLARCEAQSASLWLKHFKGIDVDRPAYFFTTLHMGGLLYRIVNQRMQ